MTRITNVGGLGCSTYLGSETGVAGDDGDDIAWGISPDGRDHVIVAGQTESLGFPATPGAFQTGYGGGNSDAFVAKFRTGNPMGQ